MHTFHNRKHCKQAKKSTDKNMPKGTGVTGFSRHDRDHHSKNVTRNLFLPNFFPVTGRSCTQGLPTPCIPRLTLPKKCQKLPGLPAGYRISSIRQNKTTLQTFCRKIFSVGDISVECFRPTFPIDALYGNIKSRRSSRLFIYS